MRGAFGSLQKKVSAADRLRLEAHVEALRDLEAKTHFVPPTGCDGGVVPSGYTMPNSANGYRGLNVMADLMLDIMVRTLACGARRIVTLQDVLFDSPPFEFLPGGPITSSSWHVKVHNNYDNHNEPQLQESFLYFAQVFDRLLSKLDAIVEPNGKTLLDNSVVVWLSEFGTGATHDADNLPIVIAGGGQGRIGLGRHLERQATTNDFFTSLLQAFGVMDTSFGFGAAGLNHGGISGLLT